MALSATAWRTTPYNQITKQTAVHNLSYRPMSSSDASALNKIASDWSVVRQLGGWPWPASKAFIFGRCVPYAGDGGFFWAVCRDGALCGSIAVTSGHIGYMLDPAAQGQGVMTQAATDAIEAYFATGAAFWMQPLGMTILRRNGFWKSWVLYIGRRGTSMPWRAGFQHCPIIYFLAAMRGMA